MSEPEHKHEWHRVSDDPMITRVRCAACGDVALYTQGQWINLSTFIGDDLP